MTQLEMTVRDTVQKFNMLSIGDTVVAGVSGGADSVALLHMLYLLKDEYKLNIICVHLNHGIRGDEADRDQEYVQSLCNKLGIECICEYRDIPSIASSNGQSEELAGRNERYRLFKMIAADNSNARIAVAHNKNDSVETVIMKLARGSSLNGLKGIPAVNADVIRPLIECERHIIEAHLIEYDIPFMSDSTNTDTKYTRNLVRNEIIPLMQRINPGLVNTVYNNCKSISDDDDFITNCVSEHAIKCISHSDGIATIDLSYFRTLHIALKRRIILYAAQLLNGNLLDIEQKHIDLLTDDIPTGKKYDLSAGLKAYTEYNKLCICKGLPESIDYEYDVDIGKIYTIDDKRIFFELCDNNDMCDKSCMFINADGITGAKIMLRNRRDGDSFVPSGMNGTKKLKSFFIDNKVPQSIRNTTPLLCINGEIAAVLGMRVSNKYIVSDKTKKILKVYIDGGTNE